MTDRGFVTCGVTVPIGVCDNCGAKTLDQDAEAVLEAAVQKAYEQLPK